MPFGNHTPESLLARSDSKDPATTCKGLTTTGRPCRRALAASAVNSPAGSPNAKGNGVVAIIDEGDAAAFFCWQHKDQAEALVAKLSERTQVLPLKQKSSIDTLIERMGVVQLDDEHGNQHQSPSPRYSQPRYLDFQSRVHKKRDTLPREWQTVQGPLMRVPHDVIESERNRRSRPRDSSRHRRRQPQYKSEPRSNVRASWGCCIRADDEELPPSRKRESRQHTQRPSLRPRSRSRPNTYTAAQDARYRHTMEAPAISLHSRADNTPEMRQKLSPSGYSPVRQTSESLAAAPIRKEFKTHLSSSPLHSQTANFLSLIPRHLSPSTTSALLSELAKPISPADEEGYIYIFWLTPESDISKPDDETASTLLDVEDYSPSPSPSRPTLRDRPRRKSEIDRQQTRARLTTEALRRFASVKHTSKSPEKILLKIGRANNVHRRLSEWTRQCGQNITLIRYYPYHPRSQPPEPASFSTHKTVPHVHRVERLIHLELADQRVAGRGKCDQCGREHKEWFEVEATREGVRAVDEVVRRWVEWAQGRDS